MEAQGMNIKHDPWTTIVTVFRFLKQYRNQFTSIVSVHLSHFQKCLYRGFTTIQKVLLCWFLGILKFSFSRLRRLQFLKSPLKKGQYPYDIYPVCLPVYCSLGEFLKWTLWILQGLNKMIVLYDHLWDNLRINFRCFGRNNDCAQLKSALQFHRSTVNWYGRESAVGYWQQEMKKKKKTPHNLPEMRNRFWGIEEHFPSPHLFPATRRPAKISMHRTTIAYSLMAAEDDQVPREVTQWYWLWTAWYYWWFTVCWAVAGFSVALKLSACRYDLLIDQA